MLFPRLFEQSVARTPDRTAVVNLGTGREYSYRELADDAHSVAVSLRERGIEKGDRVAICTGNRPEHVITFLATQTIGAVAVPFNFRIPAGGVRYHVQDSEPELFLFDSLSREAVEGAAEDLDVAMMYASGAEDDPPEFADRFDSLLEAPAEEPEIVVDGDDPSVILYSSGTTGDPKGMPLDHQCTTGRAIINSLGQHYYLGETIPGVMPLYHTVGLHGVLCCVLGMSGTYLTMPRFDPETYTRAIEEYGVTALHEAPTIFQNILNSEAISEVDVGSVRTLGFSGAPMSTATFEALQERFDPDHFANLYGTTEVYGTLAYVDLQDIGQPAVVGKANVFIETRVVDFEGNDPDAEVEPGEEGELIVNTESPVSFEGYLNKPAKTDAAIHDGWFFTGDAVYERDDGNLVITGRADDVIISGGENIHPANVEDVLTSHPSVADVGVIGVPDDEWGEIVKAFVQPDGDVTEEELDQWCLEHDDFPDFQRPRAYEFVEEVPRNPSGKVMRYKLRGEE